MKNVLLLGCATGLLIAAGCAQLNVQVSEIADTCFQGKVYDGNGGYIVGGVSVKAGKILSVPCADDGMVDGCVQFSDDNTKIVDLADGYIYPGFVDAHAHLLQIGLREMTMNLEGVASIEVVKSMLVDAVSAANDGVTIFGRGWIETHWPEGRFLNKTDLNVIAPDHPVLFQRWGGHAIAANSKRLIGN